MTCIDYKLTSPKVYIQIWMATKTCDLNYSAEK